MIMHSDIKNNNVAINPSKVVENYINQVQQVINKTNQETNANLTFTFHIQEHDNQVQVTGFID